MAISPDHPVVAVFGTNDATLVELTAAEILGAAVQRAQAVLLTRGSLKPSRPGHVEEAAIFAANRAASPDRPARWIGVANRRARYRPAGAEMRRSFRDPGG